MRDDPVRLTCRNGRVSRLNGRESERRELWRKSAAEVIGYEWVKYCGRATPRHRKRSLETYQSGSQERLVIPQDPELPWSHPIGCLRCHQFHNQGGGIGGFNIPDGAMRFCWCEGGYEWARFGCLPCWSQTYLGEELSHTLADKHGWDGGGSDLTLEICVSVPSLQDHVQTQVGIGALLHQCPRPTAAR